MTRHGKTNLLAMIALPVFAALCSIAVFGMLPATQAFVFGTNAIPMLIGGAVSGLLLRSANKAGRGHGIALWPTLLPAGAGVLWYLYAAAAFEADAGREYFAGPFYLLAGVLVTAVVATIAYLLSKR